MLHATQILRMFEAVCDSGNFGAAAQQLHTVQSNITAHIKKLEDEVGAQLLVRANPVFPTPAGHTLAAFAIKTETAASGH